MLKLIINGMITKLQGIDSFELVEFNEGQLEDLENSLITPPHALVSLDVADNVKEGYVELDCGIKVQLCTSHMGGANKNGMYDLIMKVIEEIHGAEVYESENGAEMVFFKSFREVGIFPGLCVFEMTFRLGALN